jgi:hypothetical protein
MTLRSFLAFLRSLRWRDWALLGATVALIFVTCGWRLGAVVLAVGAIALIPAVTIGMRAQDEKRRRETE